MRNTGSTAAGRRRRPRAMRWAVVAVAVLWAVSPARAVRKCCPGPDEVSVARTAAAEMQCARGGRLSAAVWARGDAAAAPAGPPPGCAGALAVDVWVLGGGGARAVVVARCAARASACGEGGGGGGGGGGSGDRDFACVTKCCPSGQSFVGKRCTRTQAPLQLDFRTSFAESAAPARVALIEKRPRCTEGFVVSEPNKYPDDNWHSQRDGRVFRPSHSKMYTSDGYCVEHANSSSSTGFVSGVHAFICMRPQHMGETKAG